MNKEYITYLRKKRIANRYTKRIADKIQAKHENILKTSKQ